MKRTLIRFFFAVALVSLSSIAVADLGSFMQDVNRQALSDIRNFNNKLSSQFGIPVPNVDAIVKAVPNPADAFMILQLSQMAHVAPEVVLQKYQRDKHQGWGRMAQDLGIKPGSPEFHALKRGDLSFTGERYRDREDEDRRGPPGREFRGEHGRGRDHGRGGPFQDD